MVGQICASDVRIIPCGTELEGHSGRERDNSLFFKGDDVNSLKMSIKKENWRGYRGSEDIKLLTHT